MWTGPTEAPAGVVPDLVAPSHPPVPRAHQVPKTRGMDLSKDKTRGFQFQTLRTWWAALGANQAFLLAPPLVILGGLLPSLELSAHSYEIGERAGCPWYCGLHLL